MERKIILCKNGILRKKYITCNALKMKYEWIMEDWK